MQYKVYCMATTSTYTEWRYQMLNIYNLTSWGWAYYCSKHVEERNIMWIKKFCALSLYLVNSFYHNARPEEHKAAATSRCFYRSLNSRLVLILHIPCSTTGPYLLLNIFFYVFIRFISVSLMPHVSLPYTAAGFTVVLCVLILCALHKGVDLSTGLFKMIVGVLTTCHTQYTWDSSI